jgi:uncharacterized protein (TIRG00374 family)
LFYFKLVATALLLVVLLLRVDLARVVRAVCQFRGETWLINLLLFLAAFIVASLKWRLLLPHHTFGALLKMNFIGQYYSTLLPGQFVGEIVKAYRLGRGKQDAAQIAASVAIDRITGVLGLLVVALAGAICSRNTIDPRIFWSVFIFATALSVGIFCLRFPYWSRLLRSVPVRFEGFVAPIQRLIDASARYLDQPILLLLSIVLGACYQLIAIWINFRFGQDLGVGMSFADWCWVFGLISLVSMLPFTIAGLGLREGSFVGALTLFAVPAEKALALSLAIFALLLFGAAIGAVLEWTSHPKARDLNNVGRGNPETKPGVRG